MSKRRREIQKRKQQQEQELAQEQLQQTQEELQKVKEQLAQAQTRQVDEPVSEEPYSDDEIFAEPSVPVDKAAEADVTDNVPEPDYDDDSDIVAPSKPPVPKAAPKKRKKARRDEPASAVKPESTGWFARNKENLLLGMLVIYVFLLGLGTVGELFEIEGILNMWLFR